MRRWFLPNDPHVLGLLLTQAQVTIEGMVAFEAWTRGDASGAEALRDAEHRADDAKRDLQRALRAAFSTPLDAEDIYEMSERLDAVIGAAKDLVREAEALKLAPDPPLGEMAALSVKGVRDLLRAFEALPKNADEATAAADAAKRTSRQVEKLYETAMSATVDVDDPRLQFPRRELYRRADGVADAVTRVAERIWYAVVKQS